MDSEIVDLLMRKDKRIAALEEENKKLREALKMTDTLLASSYPTWSAWPEAELINELLNPKP